MVAPAYTGEKRNIVPYLPISTLLSDLNHKGNGPCHDDLVIFFFIFQSSYTNERG